MIVEFEPIRGLFSWLLLLPLFLLLIPPWIQLVARFIKARILAPLLPTFFFFSRRAGSSLNRRMIFPAEREQPATHVSLEIQFHLVKSREKVPLLYLPFFSLFFFYYFRRSEREILFGWVAGYCSVSDKTARWINWSGKVKMILIFFRLCCCRFCVCFVVWFLYVNLIMLNKKFRHSKWQKF